jgi:uncharacterized protein YggE
MKKQKLTVLLVLTCIFGQSQTKNFIDQPFIEVNGSADTLVTPNEIFIRILLSEKDTRDRIPLEEIEKKMVNALKGLALDTEKDLTTADINSNFKYYLLKSKDVIKTKLYILKVADAVMASQVFIKMEELEISNTSIERVDHSDIENIKNILRTNAIADAKTRSMALTKALNQSVGQAIHISEADSQQLQGNVSGIRIRGLSSIKNGSNELPKIDFEKIKVTVNVNAKFILK